MTITTILKRRATAPKLSAPSLKAREAFARSIVFMEFGYHAARALDYGSFVDRKPGLVPLGKIADRVIQRFAEAVEVQDAP